jgi:AraC-like DNA-binding protein
MSEPYFRYVHRSPAGIAADAARESWIVQAERCRMAAEAALPDASVELYFNLGSAGRHVEGTVDRGHLPHRAAWVVGPRERPLFIEKETRDCDIVAIRLHPWMAERVLGVPAIELRESLTDLDALWGSAVERIRDKLHQTADPAARLAIVESAVASRVHQRPVGDASAAAALCTDAERNGRMKIADLAARHGLTHRRVIELFDRSVGLKPKAFQRVRRLRRAFHLIDAAPRPSWTTIAHRCGYFDQAHFINDFRLLTGVSPTAYASTRSSVGHGFIPHRLA